MKEIFLPGLYVENISKITADILKEKDIKGLILDVDNTLVPNHVAEADENVVNWIESMKASGVRLCIVSNGARKRVVKFNEKLKLYAIHRAMKPARKAFLEAARLLELENRQIAVVGDQIFTDIYGGNRAGMFTILVKPIDQREGKFVKLKRIFERRILRGYLRANSSEEHTDGT